mgnify:CR=1 FL=1
MTLNCVSIPKKEFLATAIFESLFLDQRNWGFTVETASKVNTRWLLSLLSTFNPNHRYFGKDFVCTPEEKRKQDNVQPKMVANTNDFFTGLPVPDHIKNKIKKRTKLFKVLDDPDNPKITATNY